MLCKPSPCAPESNGCDCTARHAISHAEHVVGFSSSEGSTYLWDVSLGQYRAPLRAPVRVSALRLHVGRVLGLSAREHVRGVAATRVVAAMEPVWPFGWHRPVGRLPREDVGSNAPALAHIQPPVSEVTARTEPGPTLVWPAAVYAIPESFRDRLASDATSSVELLVVQSAEPPSQSRPSTASLQTDRRPSGSHASKHSAGGYQSRSEFFERSR